MASRIRAMSSQLNTTWTFRDGVDGVSVADTYLEEDSPTAANGSSSSLFIAGTVGGLNHTLFLFDISSVTGTIVSADLQLELVGGTATGEGVLINRLTQAWVESQATWNVYSTGNNWAAAGGDYTTDQQDTGTLPATIANGTIWTMSLLNLAQDAIDNRSGLLDCILVPDWSASTSVRIKGCDAPSAENRPLLTIVTSP